jgi:hypothetical protein
VLVCLDDDDRSETGGKEEEEDTGGADPSPPPLPPTHLKVLPEDILRMRTWQDLQMLQMHTIQACLVRSRERVVPQAVVSRKSRVENHQCSYHILRIPHQSLAFLRIPHQRPAFLSHRTYCSSSRLALHRHWPSPYTISLHTHPAHFLLAGP